LPARGAVARRRQRASRGSSYPFDLKKKEQLARALLHRSVNGVSVGVRTRVYGQEAVMNGKRYVYASLAALVAAAITSVCAAAEGPGQAAAGPSPEFKRLDNNHDGYVSRGESKTLKNFDKAFNEADENRDGRLDPDEFVKAQAIHARIVAGTFVQDSVITAKVKTALLKDLHLKGLDVTVETYKGTVLLSGFVNEEQQVQRAVEVASGIRGVVAVKNSLMVKT
jgi:hyperosmotically inducible protein